MVVPDTSGLNSAEKIAIIGAGKVGRALTQALQAAGISPKAILDIDPRSARDCAELCVTRPVLGSVAALPADMTLVLLCVPDDRIQTVAGELATMRKLGQDCVVAHTSGALSPEALAPLRLSSTLLASFHPIQTFAGRTDDWLGFRGCYFGASGPESALQRLEKIAMALNGYLIRIPDQAHANYHLACVLASNFLVTLAATAMEVLVQSGFARSEAQAMLLPLLNTTVANLAQLGPGQALTGPMTRGDTGTVARHCQIIRQDLPGIRELYLALGRKTLELARCQGRLSDSNVEKIENILIELEGKISQ